MVTSLKLKGMFNVGMNSSGCINVDGTPVSLKEIPFIRYDFDKYDVEEVNYINKSMEKFKLSTHLIQYKAFNGRLLNDIELTKSLSDRVAKYLYFSINQNEMLAGEINTEQLRIAIESLNYIKYDRIMIIDNTDDMTMVTAKQIIKSLAKQLGVKESSIGICNSPLCMSDNLACLTAVTAREIASFYSTNDVVATPSANHQCMNCCGCMRFYEVVSDIEAPLDAKTKTSVKKEKTEKTEDTQKAVVKTPKIEKVTSLRMFV